MQPPVAVTRAESAGEFEPDPLEAGQILEGSPEPSNLPLAEWGGTLSGLWRCTPGRFTDTEADETFVVLEGRASIVHAGERFEVGPGDVGVLVAGTETEWTVHEPLLKAYVLRSADG